MRELTALLLCAATRGLMPPLSRSKQPLGAVRSAMCGTTHAQRCAERNEMVTSAEIFTLCEREHSTPARASTRQQQQSPDVILFAKRLVSRVTRVGVYVAGLQLLHPLTLLTHLGLSDCHLITSAGVAELLARTPALRRLQLGGCSGLTDAAAVAMGTLLPALTELDLCG